MEFLFFPLVNLTILNYKIRNFHQIFLCHNFIKKTFSHLIFTCITHVYHSSFNLSLILHTPLTHLFMITSPNFCFAFFSFLFSHIVLLLLANPLNIAFIPTFTCLQGASMHAWEKGEIAANENKRAITCGIQETKKGSKRKNRGERGGQKKREYNTKSLHSLF